MANTTNLSIRLDRELKEEADKIFSSMGMSLTTAITVFVRQAVRERKIPFEISLLESEDNLAILREAFMASERIWQSSVQNETDDLTLDEINAEIAAARLDKQALKASA